MLYGMERPKKEGAEDPSNSLRMLIAALLLEPLPGQMEFQVSAGAPHSKVGPRRAGAGRLLPPAVPYAPPCSYEPLGCCRHLSSGC